MILFPRFHLMEIEDQSWCPSWLRESSHSSLAQMWKTQSSKKGSPASQACDLIFENLDDVADFTFIDACAGAGGPTPLLEARLNQTLRSQGKAPAPFVLTDLYPDLNAWKSIVNKSENISYIENPVDATKARRVAAPGRKECRTFNLCFHHFDDPAAKEVLRSAVEEADAFVYVLASLIFDSFRVVAAAFLNNSHISPWHSIFEMTQRNFMALMNTSIVILSPLITTLIFFWNSPIHLFFTYLIPLVPLFYAIDGYVSCIRTRTPDETRDLLWSQPDLDLSEWELKSGERMVLPPFGNLYWYMGVKKEKKVA